MSYIRDFLKGPKRWVSEALLAHSLRKTLPRGQPTSSLKSPGLLGWRRSCR